jgi:hypothetical protein
MAKNEKNQPSFFGAELLLHIAFAASLSHAEQAENVFTFLKNRSAADLLALNACHAQLDISCSNRYHISGC